MYAAMVEPSLHDSIESDEIELEEIGDEPAPVEEFDDLDLELIELDSVEDES